MEREMPPNGRFDLAVSVEFAEHLPHSRAEPLVQWLTSAADIVVFSAAQPSGGGKGHVNEQMPSYWLALFRKFGFVRRDVLRAPIIHDNRIPWWYRQNIYLFVKEGHPLANYGEDFLPKEFTLQHRSIALGWRLLLRRGAKIARRVLSPFGLESIIPNHRQK